MSAREAIVLGTASQVPTRARNHHALFLRWDDLGVLFDPGEGTQRQMAHAGLAASQITHVCITHFHGDHCLGLAALFQRISLDEVPHPVEVVYPASGQVFFDRLRYASIYHDRAIIVPRPVPVQELGAEEHVVVRAGDETIGVRALDHRVDCMGYRLKERDGRRMVPARLEAAGIRGANIGELSRAGQITVDGRTVRLEEVSEERPGQSFALVMDTRPCDGARGLARDVDLLVCESTYLNTEHQEAHDHHHMTAAQAGQLAREAGARRLLLTHFSQRYLSTAPFAEEARLHHDDVIAADDFTVVSVPRRAAAAL